MQGPCFEDFATGDVVTSEPVRVSEAEIVAFAAAYDAQPFHLDPEAAKATFVGRLIASGWHTAALGMRLLQASAFRGGSSMGAPGIDELRWLKPVLPDTELRAVVTIGETRTSDSKPDRGFVRMGLRVEDGAGDAVMTQGFTVILPRRGAEPLPPRTVAAVEPGPVAESDDAVLMPFLGEAEIGIARDLGAYAFTAEDIVAFARAYDPQVFHLDPEAARRTHFGGLCASGWHTAAIYMKRLLITRARDIAHTTAATGRAPMLGPSPGFRAMRWLAPVYAGDTLRYETRLVEKRASISRPGWGLAFAQNSARNQHGAEVFSFRSAVFWQWGPS
ncbi:MaoC family dehydratase [Methylobacterium sp. A54F]